MSDSPREADEEERTTVTIRRAPKFSVFVVVGALVGIIAALVLASIYPADPAVGFGATFGLLSLFGIAFGGLIGAAVAILFDRRASRRATQVIAGKLAVRVDDEQSETEDDAPQDDG
ncbi:uncharacterized protein YqgC (DUF456 family) [Cryobacterium mesophilum]|uniref:Uncharacterized protein n=1 Tax=Terrimesophilobacter mesophilus TaxID=433647 RepID=A0A4R8V9U2_9MICO|nr:hypothetical protein [Terrimesophilobacter mesophilus]MBB5633226.1 uncharacterized protein YqgC (DUF456 family) [Terrimesophilobacter mesophilus]TFB79971.1 hypothetical protein E3N84_07885 [Terrimesophilobacter mesophilus]